MTDILVSICCSTYNQKNFIRHAIDGFLMQKAPFKFEILIHDDGSKDGTVEILREYAKKHKDIIKLVLQPENRWKERMLKGQAFGYEPLCECLFPLAKGKYLALCEGDDYWTDPNKLAVQVEYMENHPEHSMSYHRVDLVYDNGQREVFDPQKTNGRDFTSSEMAATPPGIATASKMLRNYYSEATKSLYEFASGDYLMTAYYSTFGSCGYISGIKPSIYRVHAGGVWSGLSFENKVKVVKRLNLRIYELFKKTGNKEFIEIWRKVMADTRSFGIVIPIFQRDDGKSPYYLKRCLESVYKQRYQGFEIYLVGDDYSEPKEIEKILKEYSALGRLHWKNLPVAVEREKYKDNKEALWCSGGTNASNYALEEARNDGLEYVCFLDYDDYWRPNHLQALQNTINETRAVWLCTKTSVDKSKVVFFPRGMQGEGVQDFPPSPGDCIKSSVCFNMHDLPFKIRDVFEETGGAYPGDADLWRRMAEHIKKKGLKSCYIGEYTCVHDDEGYIRRGGLVKAGSKRLSATLENVNELVTGVVVCYNTKDLMKRAYESVRKFHSNMKIIIVDGSDKKDPCYQYIQGLAGDNTRVFHAAKNIGHGIGLKVGLYYVKTPYALIFDSDIEMLKSPVLEMVKMIDDDTYGVGYIEKTAFDGHEWGSKPEHKKQGWMRYLHPYFCLIQIKEYKKYAPFIHHGAPAVNTMLDIHKRGLSEKVIKEFPGLGHSSGKGWVWEGKPREFIRHDPAGTRSYRRSRGLEEIEGDWDKVLKI